MKINLKQIENLFLRIRFYAESIFVVFSAGLLLSGCYATTNFNNQQLNYVPDAETLARGADTYRGYCQECHGEKMDGNGPRSAVMDGKPADLTSQGLHFTKTAVKGVLDYPHYSFETIRDKAKYGNSIMPPLKEVLSNKEIEELTYYISQEIRSNQ